MTITYQHVRQPISINGCELRNRIFRSAHGTLLGMLTGGVIGEPLIAYHLARARGGVALSILEAGAVHPSSVGALLAWKDGMEEGWNRLVSASHAEGMKVFQQIYHSGSTSGRNPLTGEPAWSPSGGGYPGAAEPAIAMTIGMIDEIVSAHIETGARCKAAGLDGVELHAAHGYLLHEFLSPLTNRRTDDYGGSVENRTRILRRILIGLRERLGPDYPLGVRLNGSEEMDGGLTVADQAALATQLENDGLVDFLDVTLGNYFAPHRIIAAMHEQAGYELPTSAPVTRAVSVPTLVTGRFTTLQQAEDVIASGAADMVSMVRALIAEPGLVSKSLAGKEAEVRPCIGCNQECIGGVNGPRHLIGCVVNVDAGAEWRAQPLIQPQRIRRVLVVGGGPSGMEAARTAALRGHQVEIHEARPLVGGDIALARRAPYRSDIGRIIDYQLAELERLKVRVHLNSRLDPRNVPNLDADCVVIATGSIPRKDGRQRFFPWPVRGAELPHVIWIQELFSAESKIGKRVLVLDDLGTYSPIGASEYLLNLGCEVVLASSFPALGNELSASLVRQPSAQRLNRYPSFSFLPLRVVSEIREGETRLREIGSTHDYVITADTVIMCTSGEPRRDIFDALSGTSVDIHLVGNAGAVSDLKGAIASGHAVGASI